MKKTLGYGFKLSSESFDQALRLYTPGQWCRNKKEVLADIKIGQQSGDIPKSAKPKIFKVTVEIV
jgi:hypothetical protein